MRPPARVTVPSDSVEATRPLALLETTSEPLKSRVELASETGTVSVTRSVRLEPPPVLSMVRLASETRMPAVEVIAPRAPETTKEPAVTLVVPV